MNCSETLSKDFISKYLAVGESKFYSFLLIYATNKLMLIDKGTYKGCYPDLEFLDYYDKFIILYRREGDLNYIEIAKIFRKAAHKIYRLMLKKQMTPHNARFLNLV